MHNENITVGNTLLIIRIIIPLFKNIDVSICGNAERSKEMQILIAANISLT